jgi:hypothetical protein
MPRPDKVELMERGFDRLRKIEDIVRTTKNGNVAAVEEGIEYGERVMAEKWFTDMRNFVAHASKPVTREDIAKHIILLIACFPGNREPVFGRMLCEDVGALQPSVGALESACRDLRRTSKFMPAICEVIEAVRLAEGRIKWAGRRLANIPKLVDEAKSNLRLLIDYQEQCHRKQIEQQKLYHEKQVAECVDRWKQDKPVYEGKYDSSVLEEAGQRYRREHGQEPPDLLPALIEL